MNKASDEPRDWASSEPRLRKISAEELKEILEAHARWLQSNDRRGACADLSETDLRGVDLEGADLSRANLENADLRGANLRRVNFSAANLRHADLRDGNLRDADLAGAQGFMAGQIAGSILAGTRLPEAISRFEGLDHIKETAEIARPIFLLMVLACIYAFATISSTTDASLLTNAPSELLPDVNTAIPTAGFYLAAPILIFFLHIYFHLYLEGLWEDLAGLPRIFPDGISLVRKVHPWLLVRLTARHISDDGTIPDARRTVMRRIINDIFIFIVWWLGPLTLVLFWGRYLPTRDGWGTALHIVLLMVATGYGGFGLHSYGLARALHRGPERRPFALRTALKDTRTYQAAVPIVMGVVLSILSYGTINGIRSENTRIDDIRTWAPKVFGIIGNSTFADFHKKDISTRPENWDGRDITFVKGAILEGRDLQYADARGAFMVKANLRNADLSGADLVEADLRSADLRGAKLVDADLRRANLNGADLRGAYLQGAQLADASLVNADLRKARLARSARSSTNLRRADLREADLREADLRKADLSGAVLREAKLGEANLRKADLPGADLRESDLAFADLRKADLHNARLERARLGGARMQEADLRNAILEEAGLPGAKLRKAKLSGADLRLARLQGADLGEADLRDARLKKADLRNANLKGASLVGAHLEGAILDGADLSGADLTGTRNLTQAQLDRACGDQDTRPRDIKIQPCP